MTLPNFVVIGAQKCATSSLCAVLGRHPDVFMCEPKEPYFFSHDEVFAKGLAWYESLFAGAKGERAIGEGSTTYTQPTLYPKALERMHARLPDARLIYIAREPLARIESHYLHLAGRGGRETRPFCEAVRASPWYLDNTLYHKQVSLFLERYPKDRMLGLFFEDFNRDADAVARRCFEFLGVDPAAPLEYAGERMNSSEDARVDTGAMRALRRVPGFDALRDLAPRGVRSKVRAVFKRKVERRPEWDDATKAWALERLVDDSEAYCAMWGKPRDFWKVRERLEAFGHGQ
ncbi:MAG: sulfotransferase family protein [Phycisphaerales bacterium]